MSRFAPVVIVIGLAGCAAQEASVDSPSVEPSSLPPSETADTREAECEAEGGRWSAALERCTMPSTPRPTPESTPEPVTLTADIGQVVTITCGETECLDITVTEPGFVEIYPDPNGFLADEPRVAGNVFMQVFVEYVALDDAASFNQFDWQVFADGRLVDDYAFTTNGPKPELSSGQLPRGRTASGWLVYEVPAAGEIILAYAPNFDGPPVFEITIRE